jgi:drug/metabolite transporter (DMT)-like permease
MIGVTFALIASTFFALNSVVTRRGVITGYVYSSVLISITLGIPIYIVASYLLGELSYLISNVTIIDIYPFILAGILHFVIGRYILYTAIRYIGASSSLPIAATSQALASFIAIPILNESVTFFKILGIIMTSLGILLIASIWLGKWTFKKGLILAASSSLIFASTSLLVRYGLTQFSAPTLGVLVSYLSALLVYLIPLGMEKNIKELKNIPKKPLMYFALAGLLVNIGQLFRYLALNLLEVSIASPIISTLTIQTILFSYLINKEIEVINLRNTIGSIIIFIGITMVILGA